MKQLSTSDLNLIAEIKTFIPTQFVMTSVAYRNPKAIERTINNIYNKVIESFKSANPRKAMVNIAPEIQYEIEKVINMRILIQ